MPKHPTYPLILDRCYTVSIGNFRRWGALSPGRYQSGSIHWGEEGERQASVGYCAFIDLAPGKAYIQFNYNYDGEPMQWRVPLLSMPANIGKGLVWFFRCPITGQRCKKLHLVDGRFMHRSAVRGAMYKRQAESKKWRLVSRLFDLYDVQAGVWDEIHKPHFKAEYRGKETRRCVRLMRKLRRAESGMNVEQVLSSLR